MRLTFQKRAILLHYEDDEVADILTYKALENLKPFYFYNVNVYSGGG